MSEWQWRDLDPDDNPFGQENVDAIVYSDQEIDPELAGIDSLREAGRPRTQHRPPPRRPDPVRYAAWEPSSTLPEPPSQTWKGPSVWAMAVPALVVLLLVAFVWFFVGVYQGKYFGEGTVPSRPGPAPTTAPAAPPAG